MSTQLLSLSHVASKAGRQEGASDCFYQRLKRRDGLGLTETGSSTPGVATSHWIVFCCSAYGLRLKHPRASS